MILREALLGFWLVSGRPLRWWVSGESFCSFFNLSKKFPFFASVDTENGKMIRGGVIDTNWSRALRLELELEGLRYNGV